MNQDLKTFILDDSYFSGDKIELQRDNSRFYCEEKILREILNNEELFEFTYKFLNKEIDSFDLRKKDKEEMAYKSLSRVDLILLLSFIEKSKKENKLADELYDLVSEDRLVERLEDIEKLLFEVDGNLIEIKSDNFTKIINTGDYKNFLNNVDSKEKRLFAYCFYKFFKEYNIEENYLLDIATLKFIKDLESSYYVDIDAFNKFLKQDRLVDKIELDQEFEKTILDKIPEDLGKTEKAIYLYFILCDSLRYDEEFYAMNQGGKAEKRHRSLDNIKNINLENNRVVCFDFTAIYAKLLDRLGINSKINTVFSNQKFESTHSFLEFRVDDYLIVGDSAMSIVRNDLSNLKVTSDTRGLTSFNKNEKRKEEFERIRKTILDRFKKESKRIKFEDALSAYRLFSEDNKIDFEEKWDIFESKVREHSDLVGLDKVLYIKELKDQIFPFLDRRNNIGFYILKDNIIKRDNEEALPAFIIVKNKDGIYQNPDTNDFYLAREDGSFKKKTKDELDEIFKNKELENNLDIAFYIPGLEDFNDRENKRSK